MLSSIINFINLASAILIIISVLLQNKGTGLSATFGGDAETFYTRRGFDKMLFWITVVLGILLCSSTLARIVIS